MRREDMQRALKFYRITTWCLLVVVLIQTYIGDMI